MKHNVHVMFWLTSDRNEAARLGCELKRIIEIAGVVTRYAFGTGSVERGKFRSEFGSAGVGHLNSPGFSRYSPGSLRFVFQTLPMTESPLFRRETE